MLRFHDPMGKKRFICNHPVFFGLPILFCCWFVAGIPYAQGNPNLINTIDMPGVTLVETPYHFEPRNLFEHINGAADFYVAYGFISLEGAHYLIGSDSNNSATVDIYDMGEKINAFGVYQSKRSDEAPTLNIGAASFGVDGYIAFYKDRYFVEINAFIKSEQWKKQPLKIARDLADKIPGDNLPPKELSFFSEQGRINGSEKYIVGGILGHAFLDRGVACDYTIEAERASAFVSFFPSKRDATSSFEHYMLYLKDQEGYLPLEGLGEQGVISQEPYHKHILVIQKDRFIIGVYDLTVPENGKHILKDIAGRLDRR